MLGPENLRERQIVIRDAMLRMDAALIVLPMGAGKTIATLTALRWLLDSFTVRKVLVVAPKLVAETVWPVEIKQWSHTKVLSCAVCVGTEAQRRAALAQDAEITVVNRDVLPWLAKHLGSKKNWPWDCVVVDESSMFKAGKKRTSRARVKKSDGTIQIRKGGNMTRFGVLTAARSMVRRMFLLTGTPAPNGVEDLWGQIYLVDQGRRLGQSQTSFRDRWFDENRYTKEIKPKDGAEAEIMKAIEDVMISLPPEKLVEEPVFVPIRVTLPKQTMMEYRAFQRSLISETYDVEAVTRGVLVNKLLQFSNGSMFREDGTVVPVHDEKLDALDDLIERANGEPVLIFYSYKFDRDAILKRHPDAVLLNSGDDVVGRWNAGKIKKLLAHPASCAHGLNLQYGGHIAIWFGLTWSLELYLQANARLPRPGQTEVVVVYQIIAEGTYDERVLEVLARKEVTQDMVIESAVKAIRES